MKVSVSLIVYNQEQYVARTIESILMQQTTFNYEVVIGEDASTDRTRDIVLGFQQKYPEKVRVLLRERDDAEAERARGLGGKTNFLRTLAACRGDYVALLDGDDFWTDPRKLQKQADFLDAHSECVISFHDVEMLSDDESCETAAWRPPAHKPRLTIEDLLDGNFIFSCSVMFRRQLVGEIPDWYHLSLVGDWPLYVMLAQHGDIGHLDEVMAAYRIHGQGFWSSKTSTARFVDGIKLLDHLNEYLGRKYETRIRSTQAKFLEQLAEARFQEGDSQDAKRFSRKAIKLNISSLRFPSKSRLLRSIKFESPRLYHLLRSLRRTLSRNSS